MTSRIQIILAITVAAVLSGCDDPADENLKACTAANTNLSSQVAADDATIISNNKTIADLSNSLANTDEELLDNVGQAKENFDAAASQAARTVAIGQACAKWIQVCPDSIANPSVVSIKMKSTLFPDKTGNIQKAMIIYPVQADMRIFYAVLLMKIIMLVIPAALVLWFSYWVLARHKPSTTENLPILQDKVDLTIVQADITSEKTKTAKVDADSELAKTELAKVLKEINPAKTKLAKVLEEIELAKTELANINLTITAKIQMRDMM